jgi:sigma-E factor negative regulatory protein RseA
MEKISALMDGELDGQQAQQQIRRLGENEELASNWHAFHLIGDAMRNERPLSPGFSQRVNSRIAAEPTILAPRRSAS